MSAATSRTLRFFSPAESLAGMLRYGWRPAMVWPVNGRTCDHRHRLATAPPDVPVQRRPAVASRRAPYLQARRKRISIALYSSECSALLGCSLIFCSAFVFIESNRLPGNCSALSWSRSHGPGHEAQGSFRPRSTDRASEDRRRSVEVRRMGGCARRSRRQLGRQ